MSGFNSANGSMVLSAAAMSALAVSSFAREITGFSVDAENMTATVVLGEAAADGETNAVYYVWSADGQDKGDGIASWPNVLKLGIVDETDEARTFALAEEARAVRADGVDVRFDPDEMDADFVAAVKSEGLSFHVWTLDELPLVLRAFAVGADTVTTNRAKQMYDEYCALYAPEPEARDEFSDRVQDGAAFPVSR